MTTRRLARSARSGNASFTVSASGVQAGDELFLLVQLADQTTTLTAPSAGWDLLAGPVNMGTRRAYLLHRTAGPGEPSTYTITTALAVAKTATLVAVYGAAPWSSAVVGAGKLRNTITENDTTNVAPAITMPGAGTVLVFSAEATSTADTVAPTVSPGAPWYWSTTADVPAAQTEQNWVGYQDVLAAGAVGPWTVTYQNVQASNGWAIAVGLPSAPPAAPEGVLTGVLETPTGPVEGFLAVVTAPGVAEYVHDVRLVQHGARTVTELLATEPFYVAHRGGSADWPECTLHAYTQSACRGMDALELSMARSSDGVWFGLHDQTLDRVAGVSGNVNPNALTWATIQANYQVQGDPDRPFMRWEELRDTYGDTHVLFTDNKHANTAPLRAEYLAMLAGMQDRVVVKYHSSNTVLGLAARAQGFQTWGYYYHGELTDGTVNLAATHAAWSMLGLDYSAPQSRYDELLALGKPVIAHVCPTAIDAATGISKGAHGAMVAGVRSVAGY